MVLHSEKWVKVPKKVLVMRVMSSSIYLSILEQGIFKHKIMQACIPLATKMKMFITSCSFWKTTPCTPKTRKLKRQIMSSCYHGHSFDLTDSLKVQPPETTGPHFENCRRCGPRSEQLRYSGGYDHWKRKRHRTEKPRNRRDDVYEYWTQKNCDRNSAVQVADSQQWKWSPAADKCREQGEVAYRLQWHKIQNEAFLERREGQQMGNSKEEQKRPTPPPGECERLQRKKCPDRGSRVSQTKKGKGKFTEEAEDIKDFADDKQWVPGSAIEQEVRDPKWGHTAPVPLTIARSQTTPKLSCFLRTI